VHDPSCLKVGDYYYMYSTDAILHENRREARRLGVPLGFIQKRRSRDLVNWEFVGWAFDSIPAEAVEWVRMLNNGRGAYNIWAPYIIKAGDRFRLYYSVSAFGRPTSYIGVAESDSPEGPWTQTGCVVKTDTNTPMNAIDPTVIADTDGRWWMHYGSYFGGIYCVELDPATGLTKTPGDLGHLTARRANYKVDNLEAPEILYHPDLDTYYLFGSYEPLLTTYNVRVCRSDRATGPFIDFHGREMRDTTNNYPILTAPYRFDRHDGWAGTGHCGVFSDGNGRYFMVHQGRLSPGHDMMDLHLRQVFFTPSGWPVVSPERYAGVTPRHFDTADLSGVWEIIHITDPRSDRELEAGQVLWGEGGLKPGECAVSQTCAIYPDGYLTATGTVGNWSFDDNSQTLSLTLGDRTITDLIVHAGHDWERQADTVLFTGLDADGNTVWGKRVK
ncbi:MAG: arabinan endo-1,5-alpha-L-arabinosidase, partial [Muribaculaceae bacterium]|nr:arabinan endo-1,5-alpha-L-arabinosidase [Muribaculaceae bacterium]